MCGRNARKITICDLKRYEAMHLKQDVLGRTNLPTFPMAVVAIVTLAKDYI
jgi:hypothetical protein